LIRSALARIVVPVVSDEAGTRHTALGFRIPLKRGRHRYQHWAFFLEHPPYGSVSVFRVLPLLADSDTLIVQPAVELGKALETRSYRKQPLPYIADLILNLPLLPACAGRAGHRLHQVMAAQLLEFAVEQTLLTAQYFMYGGLEIIIDTSSAGPLEERKCLIVGVEHHLLAFTGISNHEEHPAVA
jgi:hypothetical protein